VPITVITYAAGTRITVSRNSIIVRHSPFVERQLPASTGRRTGTPFTLHCCLTCTTVCRNSLNQKTIVWI